jgi:lupus La protein
MSSIQKLKEQIEFYFSDSNYAKDKFMNARAAENDGFVPITALLTFKRLQNMNATLELIKEAIKDSTVVELKDDGLKKVKTQEFQDYLNDTEISKRVVYIKGFSQDISLDEIKEQLSKHFTPVKVTLRRDDNKVFKGSCFVELESKEKAEEVLNMKIEVPAEESAENAKKQKLDTVFLEIISRETYFGSKKQNKTEKKDEAFAAKVKENFVPRLFNFESDREIDISEVKNVIPNVAFVDTKRNAIRFKFIQEWEEKEFPIAKSEEKSAATVKVTKMTEDQAREYLKNINIKKTGGKRN